MEINLFLLFSCFCTCKLQKNVMQSNFSISDIPKFLEVYCFPYQFIYFAIKMFWRVSSYIQYVFNCLTKMFESRVCISSVPSFNTELC